MVWIMRNGNISLLKKIIEYEKTGPTINSNKMCVMGVQGGDLQTEKGILNIAVTNTLV